MKVTGSGKVVSPWIGNGRSSGDRGIAGIGPPRLATNSRGKPFLQERNGAGKTRNLGQRGKGGSTQTGKT